MTERIAHWSFRHRWTTLIVWVVALIAVSFLGSAFKGETNASGSLPDSESQQAYDVLAKKFPTQSGDSFNVVFRAPAGVTSPAVKERMEAFFAELADKPGVESISSPYSTDGARNISQDGTIGIAQVQMNQRADDVSVQTVADWIALANNANGEGVQVELGGGVISFSEQGDVGGREWIGLIAAVIILLAAFGSIIAAGLPIVIALFGVGIGLAIVNLLANWVQVPDFTTPVAAMIGLGVGIDYALFIVTRHRHALAAGRDPEASLLESAATSGRAVIFAGTTVVISLLGILLMRFSFMNGLALGAAATVIMVMAASITLLPAILGFSGHKIDKLRVPFVGRVHHDHRQTTAWRWSRQVQRRPWVWATLSLAVMVALALPFFSMHLAFSDEGNNPTSTTSRRAYDLTSEGFGPGLNGPLVIAIDTNGDPNVADDLAQALEDTPGIARVQPAQLNDDGSAAVVIAFPTTAPQDKATDKLVHHIRRDVVPSVTEGTNVRVYVGGITATGVDFSDTTSQRLPYFIGAVILLSFLLLLVVFRSVLVPVKAAIMNLLSVGAAYGVVVAIFQWGWLGGLVGVEKGPIEPWAPMMMFAILFGLSMDYEVFLISRIREEYLKTHDNAGAVADGLAATARVITAAAAIMICVFFSFVLSDSRALKLMGIGLSVAVLVDATIVRMILVPSTMELLGDKNWWFPRWLEKVTPHVSVEREDLPEQIDQPVPEPVG